MNKINYLDTINIYGGDILCSKGMELSKHNTQHGSTSVYDHSLAVAQMCLIIVHYLHIKTDISSLIRGALLHDYFLYDWHVASKSHRLHGFTHAKKSLQNAEQDFQLTKIERNMIKRHMFPLNICPPRYRESVILCLADKICAVQEIFIKGK